MVTWGLCPRLVWFGLVWFRFLIENMGCICKCGLWIDVTVLEREGKVSGGFWVVGLEGGGGSFWGGKRDLRVWGV